jgi:hypothetical protein
LTNQLPIPVRKEHESSRPQKYILSAVCTILRQIKLGYFH